MSAGWALALSLAGAVLGYAARWLTPGGAAAAVLVGTACLWGAGLRGGVLLAAFFLSGSLLTRMAASRDRTVGLGAKGGRRDAWQVVANGGVAALGGLVAGAGAPVGLALLVGALAAATADTWATEIGAFARAPPRRITTGEIVPPGTSGGITWLGTAGGLAGAVAVGALGATAWNPRALVAGGWIALAGAAGMLADSLAGATVQAAYRCDCGAVLETPAHGCGGSAARVRGVRWITNDVVNLLGTLIGGGAALGLLPSPSSWGS